MRKIIAFMRITNVQKNIGSVNNLITFVVRSACLKVK